MCLPLLLIQDGLTYFVSLQQITLRKVLFKMVAEISTLTPMMGREMLLKLADVDWSVF